VIADTDSCK